MGLAQFSLSNLSNSVSEWLSAALLNAGYLIYWAPLDALQTPEKVYLEFNVNQANILSDPDVAAYLSASRGTVTLQNEDFSFPRVPTRPTGDGSIANPDDMPVPSIVTDVSHASNGLLLGIGDRQRNRFASLVLLGLARDNAEQMFLADLLRVAFDESQFVPIHNHDDGTRDLVGSAELQRMSVSTAIYPQHGASTVYEFTVNARLRYEA